MTASDDINFRVFLLIMLKHNIPNPSLPQSEERQLSLYSLDSLKKKKTNEEKPMSCLGGGWKNWLQNEEKEIKRKNKKRNILFEKMISPLKAYSSLKIAKVNFEIHGDFWISPPLF